MRFERWSPTRPTSPSAAAAAHASDAVMMGETPQGFRYLAAEPPAASGGPRERAPPCGRSRWASRSIPNVDGALPFGGLGYLDLDRSAAARR